MNNKNNTIEQTGPQGTQAFNIDEVNKMIAEQIINSQSGDASMPALIGLSEGLNGKEFIFSKNKFSIGRNPDSDIVLSEASVSSMHAQIIKIDDEWKVLNLLSSNGTFVNGEKVAEKIIVLGDRIAFAEAEFVYALVEPQASEENNSTSNSYGLIFVGLALVAAFTALFYFIL